MNRQKLENLSGKIEPMHNWNNTEDFNAIPFVDVKEAVKELKECFGVCIFGNKLYTYTAEMINKKIDAIFGEKLTGEKK